MTSVPALGRTVLAADELFCSPHHPQIVEWIRSTIPSHHLDQLDAAAGLVLAGITSAVAEGVVESATGLPPGEHPDWIRLGALSALATWLSPHPGRPEPIVAAAWRPDVMVCGRCTHLLKIPRRSAADRTCDACGRVCTGAADDLIYPAALIVGPMQYLAGVCAGCRYWPDPATEKNARDADRQRPPTRPDPLVR